MPAPNYDGSAGFGGAFYANYKQLYGPKNVEAQVYKNKWLLKKIRKVDDFEGANYVHSVFYEDPQVGTASFTAAQNQANATTQTARFTIWRGRIYGAINLDNEEIEASRSDAGGLVRKKAYETNRVLNEIGNRVNIAISGDGSGILGSFTTSTAADNQTGQAVITLDNPTDRIKFAVGQRLQMATNWPKDGTPPTLANAGSIVTVLKKFRSGNKAQLLVSSNLIVWNPSIATTTQYYLLNAGDGVGFGVNVLNGGVSGLEAWLPTPTYNVARLNSGTDNMWGANRTIDEAALAGVAYAAPPGETYATTFANIGSLMATEVAEGAGDNYTFMCPPDNLARMEVELGPLKQIIDNGSDTQAGTYGYRPIKIRNQFGTFQAIANPYLPANSFKLVDLDDIYIKSLKAVPHLDESDGLSALRLSNSDGIQMRWRAWYQLIVNTPKRHLAGRFAS